MSGKGLVNIQSAIAVCVVAAVLVRSRKAGKWEEGVRVSWKECIAFFAVVLALVLAVFAGDLHNPFLFDDYHYLRNASVESVGNVLADFGHVAWRGAFWRPVMSLSLWINFRWAGRNPLLWHVYNITLHASNSLLVFVLLRLLELPRRAAWAGALFFAVFAGSVEAVVWLSGGYDLTGTFFILLAVIAMLLYSRRPRWSALAAALVFCALGCGAKESAFSIPLLGAALAIPLAAERRRAMFKASLWSLVLCAVLFPYRWWAINGIGGYTAGDAPTFLRPNPLHAANGLFFRAWGFFFFPINWSGSGLSQREIVALVVYLGVLAAMACVVRARRDLLLCALAFSVTVLLPVYQMILIASDLAGARVMYAPTIGIAILVAAVFASQPILRGGTAFAVILLFQIVWMEHNLRFWNETAGMVPSICRSMAKMAGGSGSRILLAKLPTKRDGVPFLANGFEECAAFYSGGDPDHLLDIQVGDALERHGPVVVFDPVNNAWRPR